MTDNTKKILDFLIELRKRLLYSLISLLIIFTGLLFFTNELYTLLAKPLLHYLPEHQNLIATNIVSPFFVPFELAFMVSLFLSAPVFLYQLWVFIAPALYRHEKRLLWPLLLFSTALFYLGVAFSYFVVFPLLFKFLANSVPSGVVLSPDIRQYMDFSLKLLFIFGIIFQIPIIILALVRLKIVTRERFIQFRPYAIIGAFIVGLLFAPPDILSQTVLAIPVWLLYETGIFLARNWHVGRRTN